MPELNGVLLAVEQAIRQRDDAAKVLAQAIRRLEFANQQMDQLKGYAQETDSRWTGAPAGMLSSELIKHHYQFVERLHHAIGLQMVAIADASLQVDRERAALVQTEVRLAGLKKVVEFRQLEISRKLQRREQRSTDDYAAMAYARKVVQLSRGELV